MYAASILPLLGAFKLNSIACDSALILCVEFHVWSRSPTLHRDITGLGHRASATLKTACLLALLQYLAFVARTTLLYGY